MKEITVSFLLNGKKSSVASLPNRTLLDVLREDLGLTGAKDACGGEGECGACTVVLDGNPVNSCMIFIGQVEGTQITTVEGLMEKGDYHPLQKAFVEAGAVPSFRQMYHHSQEGRTDYDILHCHHCDVHRQLVLCVP